VLVALAGGLWAAADPLALTAGSASGLGPTVTLSASSTKPVSGQRVILRGRVSSWVPHSEVRLYANPYPYRTRAAAVLATTTTGLDGSFSFTVFPDRLVSYAAVLTDTGAAAAVRIYPTVRMIASVSAQPLGRAKVVLVVFHPRDLEWNGAAVSWSFASGRHGRWAATPSTRTARLSRQVTVLFTTVTLPAGPFSVPLEQALQSPRRPPHCSGLGDWGGGSLPAGYPTASAIAGAEQFVAGRAGRASIAVVDSEGRESGADLDERFPAASVVKSMLLVAYLRHLDAVGRRHVDRNSNSFLYPMIHVSDNNAATQCFSVVGDSGLYAVARAAGMRDFSVNGYWLTAMISAGDMARYFLEMDSLIPREFVGYAHNLLSTIDPSQAWGVPAVARPLGYEVFFKGGWLPNEGVINQVARLEGHGRVFTIAVLTSGPPGMSYGEQTIEVATSRLLG
jgi:hypothetical protein